MRSGSLAFLSHLAYNDIMNDGFFMQKALEQAELALEKGEVPVGAVVVSEGKIIGQGHNECISRQDPTAHAEIVAIREACRAEKNYRLPDCDVYVTLEPCAMCLGAIVHARIKQLFYGSQDPKAGAVESTMCFPFEKVNHRPEIKGGILARECGKILKDFFQEKRIS